MNARPFYDPDDTLRLPVRPASEVSVTSMLEDQDGVLLRLEYRAALKAHRRRANLADASLLLVWGAIGMLLLWRFAA